MPVVRQNNASQAFGTFGRIAADIMNRQRDQATQLMSMGAGLQAQAGQLKAAGQPEAAADLFQLGGQYQHPAWFNYRPDGTRTIGNTAGGNTVPASLTARLAGGMAAPQAPAAPPPLLARPVSPVSRAPFPMGPSWPTSP